MAEDMGQIHERWRYNVFLSFRGEDVRNGFLSHLYESLVRSGIHTFMDDEELKRGEIFSLELLKAIENSKILLVVLSENYASSAWCLDELVHIMECRESDTGQMVFPIFYNVDPGDLRRQKGSFDKHKSRYPESKLLKWREALTQVANLAGFPIYGYSNEAKMTDRVIREILKRLPSSYLHLPTYSVGISSRVHCIYKLMCFGSDDVQVIGICGMGGIGKTTLAKAAFNEFSHRFEGTSFLENFGEYSTKLEGKVYLQRKLLSDILRRHGKVFNNMDHDVRQRFRNKRVLVVLDDVKDIKQIYSAAIDLACFGPGSRIIITCRNTHLLSQLGVEHIYSPEKLDGCESLELLSWHAFRRSEPPEAFVQLSDKLVKYCGGLPLAMEILGAFLFKRNTSQWRSTLELLKQTPNADIQAKLQISFDALDPEQKEIFLDISCFFIGMDKDYVACILDGCKLYPDIGLTVLKERCLITVRDNRLVMHDLLRDMGRNIVRGTSRNSCERWSRLWNPADVIDVLANNSGTDAIEGLSLKAGVTGVENLEAKAFSNLRKLRLLQLSHVHVKGNYAHFPRGLRWFYWFEFPLYFIPTTLHLGSLVVMDLQCSNLKRLWDDQKPQLLTKLKYLDLSHSVQLTETPDFSYLPNLETLLLINCKRLVLVHKSIGTLHNTLVLLNLSGCTELGDLPLELYTLKSLETLILSGCSQLERLDDALGELESLKTLKADSTALRQIPSSSNQLKKLKELSLHGCKELWKDRDYTHSDERPQAALCASLSLNDLSCLTILRLGSCNLSDELTPENLGSLSCLEELDLRGNNFRNLQTDFAGLLSLQILKLDSCLELQSMFSLPKRLRSFYASNCIMLERTPDLSECSVLQSLHLTNCSNLVETPGLDKLKSVGVIHMEMCNRMSATYRERIMQGWAVGANGGIFIPGSSLPNWVSYKNKAHSISFRVPDTLNPDPAGFTLWTPYVSQQDNEMSGYSPKITVKNLTKGSVWSRNPATDHIRMYREKHIWQGHFSNVDFFLETGDQVEVSVDFGDQVTILETGLTLTYREENPVTSDKDTSNIGYDVVRDEQFTRTEAEMETNVVSRPHSRLNFDVYLSFRGVDTRNNIIKHLCAALKEKKVRVFSDDHDVPIGYDIDVTVMDAMENSAAYIVVLSRNYANSAWCLDELARLCDLSSSLRRPILPIFYQVYPSHVRKQNHHFGDDFKKHATRFSEECIQRWKGAMNLVGNLSGYVCSRETFDGDAMVKWILAELSQTPEEVGEYTVGLESRIEDLMNLLDIKSSSDVQVLGLYGMGGIGKTTLAKAFYNKIFGNFKQRAFISNVRERSSDQDGLVNLQRTFINELFLLQVEDVNRDRDKIRESVHGKKILVVLDDVDNINQVDTLVGERKWYGEGSLIVITSRDEEILSRLSVNQRYEVKCLTEMQALKLFSYHSLRKEKPTKRLLDLSEKMVRITGLLPLSVEVFGSLLYDKKERKEWQVQLRKLEKIQPNNLPDVLALSFKSLNDEEKQVFLDIVCLFLGMEITKEDVVDILKGCGFKAEAALNVLRHKSLVKITANKTLWMHDHIRDMGRQMDLIEIHGDPGMRNRLCDRDEIMTVLNNMKGTSSIQGIVFDFTKKFVRDSRVDKMALKNLQNNWGINSVCNYLRSKFIRFREEEKPKTSEATIRVEPFVPMTKLRLLQINHMKLEGNLELLPSELKWIQWKGCPLKNLPPDFLSGQLAVLDLSESGIRRVQSLRSKGVVENLKVLNLSGCHSLKSIPDLSKHKSIEKLVLERCKLLVKVPRSIGHLRTLLHLDLRNCSKLSEFLEDVSGLKHLEKLFLSGCSNLRMLPKNIGAMGCLKELLLDGTAVNNLPESIDGLKNLERLSLKGCRFIKQLPLCVGTLASLEELYLDDTALQNLPSSIGNLKNLQKLHMMRCASLFEIPYTINELISLKELFINESSVRELPLKPDSLPFLTDFLAGKCKFLKQVPSSIGGLNSLVHLQLDSTPIEALPEEIGGMQFIRELELRNCKSLKFLPRSIIDMDTLHSLYLEGSNIEELPRDFGELENLVTLGVDNCKKLKRLPESFGDLKSLHHLYIQETLVAELPESFGNLSNLRVLKMQKKPLFRSSESDSPGTSEEPRFVDVPNSFSNLVLLEELDARSCRWGKIPDDFEKLSSMKILNLGNNYFHSLPSSLEGLSNLRELSLYDCRELECVPPLPWKLEQLNLANCFALESISDFSKLEILHDLNLTNCDKVADIPGLEHLMALERLYMSGCNSSCSLAVKKRLAKVSMKMMRNLSLPGKRIPDWFSQGPVTFSAQPNRELRGVILAVVVALNHETRDDYMLPDVVGVQAQILKFGVPLYTHTLHLSGVPRTTDDQLHICRYSALHPMVTVLKDGYTLQVMKRELPFKQGVELKMHGIHLVYEGDDDFKSIEHLLTETQLTEEGEVSSEGHMSPQ